MCEREEKSEQEIFLDAYVVHTYEQVTQIF